MSSTTQDASKPKVDPNGKYYETLGIDNWEEATTKTIQKAYREKARQYHPDKCNQNEELRKEYEDIFTKITEANTILQDPELKEKYDQLLKQKLFKEKQKNEMDEKTKKLRESLEAREEIAKYKQQNNNDIFSNKELASKLKESGGYDALFKVQLDRKQRINNKINSTLPSSSLSSLNNQVIVKWKRDQKDMNEKLLKTLFSRLFGSIDVIVFKEEKRKALISFHTVESAKDSINYDWNENVKYKFNVKGMKSETKTVIDDEDGSNELKRDKERDLEREQYELTNKLLRMANNKKQKTR
ncbi:hypothetical protein ABK040_013841 [Willaertia magna]